MPTFACGDLLRFGRFAPGSSGCLVRFPDFADRVLMLAAGHVVLPPFARAGDAITDDQSGEIIGRLFTWTSIDGNPTADAALIWVDPTKVSPRLRGMGTPSGINLMPPEGTRVRIHPHEGQQAPRDALIREVNKDIDVIVTGPGWETPVKVTYRGQIATDSLISEGGDSGAIALDDQNRVVGMVIGGNEDAGTIITPISAILANTAWDGRQLELVTDLAEAAAPLPPAPLADPPEPDVNLGWLHPLQKTVAHEVAALLKAGGLGALQQAAALGSAMAESSMNPMARNSSSIEDSIGLFQLNRRGGRGTGRTVEELQRIDVQCHVVLAWAAKSKPFMNATNLHDAVAAFVGDFERPANAIGEIGKREVIAQRFMPA